MTFLKQQESDGIGHMFLHGLTYWTRNPEKTQLLLEGKIPDDYLVPYYGPSLPVLEVEDVVASTTMPDKIAIVRTKYGHTLSFPTEDEERLEQIKSGNYCIKAIIHDGGIQELQLVQEKPDSRKNLGIIDILLH